MSLRALTLSLAVAAALMSSACGTPPDKEIQQAQGAIDAAKAVGAEQYAPDEFAAAQAALAHAQDAVAQRDYRLALNHALDSRERAQRAAKEAASQQAVLRSAAERHLGQVTARLDQVEQRLKAAGTTRVPRRDLADARAAITAAQESLQKAGTSIQESNYLVSEEQLSESARNLDVAMAKIDMATKARPRRK